MLVARGYGAGVSPRKYGLNGTIPALTSSSVGSSAIRDADGTTVCPRVAKWSRKRGRIPAVGIGWRPMGWGSWPVRVEGIVAAVQAEPRAQLVLALGHPFPDIGSEVADGLGQAAERAGQRTGQR